MNGTTVLTRQFERGSRRELLASCPRCADMRFEDRLGQGRKLLPLVGLAIGDVQLGQAR